MLKNNTQSFQFFKAFILVITIFILNLPLYSSAQTTDTIKSDYFKIKEYNISYTGVIGNTLGFEIGKRKECSFCDEKHRKFFGVGFELGFDEFREFVIGSKFSYQRGTGRFALNISAIPYLTSFKEFGFWLRPEFLFFPTKDHSFSIGVGLNMHDNFAKKGTNFDSFGDIGFSIKHYVKKLETKHYEN